MKKLLCLFVALTAIFAVSCNQGNDDSQAGTLEGTWISYRTDLDDKPTADIRMALIIKGDKCDLQMCAWGERYVGTYTYDEKAGQLNMHFTKFYSTGSAAFPKDMTKLENFHWVEVIPYDDPNISPLTYKFTERWPREEGGYDEEEATKWFGLERDYTIGFVVKGNTASEPGGEGWVWTRK
ncbi:MAG: hypothetical protein K6F58_06180 [Bacteroidales bacterium]|nr:hypothetical protein [Bacteroidales bacterium]